MRDPRFPKHFHLKSGVYYLVIKGKPWTRLGVDFMAAMAAYRRLANLGSTRTLGLLFDEFIQNELPKRALYTQKSWLPCFKPLREVFEKVPPGNVEPHHVWKYWKLRGETRTARMHIQVLSVVFTDALRSGDCKLNPCLGLKFKRNQARTRYVTKEEFIAVRSVAQPNVALMMDMALETGMRETDILTLEKKNLVADGILYAPGKTYRSNPKELIVEWSPALRDITDAIQELRPKLRHVLVANRKGNAYTIDGFQAQWQRTMKKAVAKYGIKRFQFRDLRAKNGSDEKTLAAAQARLNHSSPAITQRVYRRLPTRVQTLDRS